MLRRLTVRNLAIVEDLELELEAGLTVITGETGAGKSILVDAVALLAGGRGSAELVRQGADRLVVSGEFEADPGARAILAEAGLPAAETILVRRELAADGRGRAFVEDEPASVRTLARVGELLVAIHGQNSEQELAARDVPLELLDAFARTEPEREETASASEKWKAALQALEELEAARRNRVSRMDLLDFQIREVEAVSPAADEEESLSAERQRLRHADRIRLAGETALSALSEEEGSAADRLGEASRAFAELAAIDPRERANFEEAEDLKRRITDLAGAARDAASQIEADPERLTAIEGRLEKISRLDAQVRRAGVAAVGSSGALEGRAGGARRLRGRPGEAARRRPRSGRVVPRIAAERLSARRARRGPALLHGRREGAARLAMEKARFRMELEAAPGRSLGRSGLETAPFLFAPNPGEPEKPFEKIASGGELSRLQLAIRAVSAAPEGEGAHVCFRRSGRGHRRAHGGSRRAEAARARARRTGALRHARAADRRARRPALPGREERDKGPHRRHGAAAGRAGA